MPQEKKTHQPVSPQKIQEVLSSLLRLSICKYPFPRLMQEFLSLIISIPWLDIQPKGALFIVDENNPDNLILTAHQNIDKSLLKTCANLSFGHCLCGKAALNKEIIFVSQIDSQHENCCENIAPHGHYCIPIKSADDTILGVFTLYTLNKAEYSPEIVAVLQTAAAAVAGIIRLHLCEISNRESEKSYLAITNAAVDAIIMMDNHGKITFWNPAAEKVFGYSPAEALNKDLHKFIVPPEYASSYKSSLKKFFLSGEGNLFGQTIEINGLHKNGSKIPIELALSKLQIKNKWHAIGIIRDITARKLIEKEKEEINQHLQQAHRLEAIGTLAGGIAHDFNNTTASILGFAEMAQDSLPPDSQTYRDIGHIISAATRAKEITKQILTFSRQADPEKSPIQLQPLIKETIKLMNVSMPNNIEIHTDLISTPTYITASPTQLHQTLINLYTNARQAMIAKGGILSIELKTINFAPEGDQIPPGLAPGSYARLTISDTGSGIPDEAMEYIFEPFFTTKQQGEGTGLGLSIIHGIINDLDGIIKVNSDENGTSFIIFIPTCSTKEAELPPAVLPQTTKGQGHILIVEDEENLAEITSRALRKIGFETTITPDGQEALSNFKNQPDKFDLILSDQLMPKMNGTEMASEILKIKPDIPIIITTGNFDKSLLQYAMDIGIKKVIVKPLSTTELYAAAKEFT